MNSYSFALLALFISVASAEWLLQDRSADSDDLRDGSAMIQNIIKEDLKAQKNTNVAANKVSKSSSPAVMSSTLKSTAEDSESTDEEPEDTTQQSNDVEDHEPEVEEVLKNNWRLLRALAGKRGGDTELDVLLAENWMLLNLLEKKRARLTTTTEQSAEVDSDERDRETREFADHQNGTMSAVNSTMASSSVTQTTTAHQAVNGTDNNANQRVGKSNFDESSDNEDFSAETDEDAPEDDRVDEVIKQNWIKLSTVVSTPASISTTTVSTTKLPSTTAATKAGSTTATNQGAFLEDVEDEDEEAPTTTTTKSRLWWRKAQLKTAK